MVRKPFLLAASLCALLWLAGCELFTVTPFPGFTDRTDISINLGSLIDSIAAGKSPISYDLSVIEDPLQPLREPRVLLLVEPPSTDPNGGFSYTGRLIFLTKDLVVKGVGSTASTTDYFSRPYGYAQDGNVLAGYTVLNADGGSSGITISSPGMEGFAFNDGTNTYQFSTPAGQYAGFDISFIGYLTLSPTAWGISVPQNTIAITNPTARPSTSDPNYANLGYQLVGLAYDSTAPGYVTFVLSEPAQGRVMAVRTTLALAKTPGTVLLPGPTSWPVPASAWPMAVTVDRPELHADVGGFFMIQRDGWLTRYTWTGGATLSQSGSSQIVGDRSLSRHYAFLTSQTQGPYMYRFDPASRVLTRYKRWWR